MSMFNESLRSLFHEANEIAPLEGEERYIDFHFLAEGSVKEVYEAYDSSTGRKVAIAFLKEGSSQESYDDFIREARIHALLQHPHILPLYDFDYEESGRPYMVAKLMTGSNLLKYLDRADATQVRALEFFERVAAAVGFAHSRGILHLDIKPDNVMLDEFGEVLLCDWGISRLYSADCEGKHSLYDENINDLVALVQSERRQHIQGTPGFMSPEQVRGDFDRLSPTSDIYSLGAMLYLILYKKLPVTGKTHRELLENTLKGNLRSSHGSSTEVESGLRAICLKSLKLRPSLRYQSVSEMLVDLNRLKSGYAPKAEVVNNMDLLRLILKRNKSLVLVAGVATLLLFFILSASVLFVNLEKEKVEGALELTESLNKDLLVEKEKREHMAKFAAERFINKGLDALAEQHYEKAEEAFTTAHMMAPNSLQVKELFSLMSLSTGEVEELYKFEDNETLGELAKLVGLCLKDETLTPLEVRRICKEIQKTPYKSFARWYLKSCVENPNWSQLEQGQVYALYISDFLQLKALDDEVACHWVEGRLHVDLKLVEFDFKDFPQHLPIEKLSLRNCRVKFSEVKLNYLKELDLSHSKVTDLLLLKAPQLVKLTLDSSQFKMTELEDFKTLEELSFKNVSGNKLVSILYSLPRLEKVYVSPNFRRLKYKGRFKLIRE